MKAYKNRTLDPSKQVEVYRCLNRQGKTFSIRQDGLVVAHAESLILKDAVFVVNESGKARCQDTQERNVHAHVEGILVEEVEEHPMKVALRVKYDPFSPNGFVLDTPDDDPVEIYAADYAVFGNGNLWAFQKDQHPGFITKYEENS